MVSEFIWGLNQEFLQRGCSMGSFPPTRSKHLTLEAWNATFLPLAQNPSLVKELYSIIYWYYLIQDTSSSKALVFINLQDAVGWLCLKIQSIPKQVPLTLEVSMWWWWVRLWPQIVLLGFSTVFCWVLPAEVNFKDFLLMYQLHFSIQIGHMLQAPGSSSTRTGEQIHESEVW